jgi:hypothetical protein
MVIKYNNIFHSKTLKNYPNWDFWFENKPSGNPGYDWTTSRLQILAICVLLFNVHMQNPVDFFNLENALIVRVTSLSELWPMYDCFHHWQIFDNITSGSKFGDFFNF